MATAMDGNGGVLPDGQDGVCQTSSGLNGATSGAAEAKALWTTDISPNLQCAIVCCAA